ncbi:MAG: hypothetical protein SFV54_12175, partial [Bryobacteraceae bacterium]|nr:hypothetical protein [Bryobacteraceae bacterium]
AFAHSRGVRNTDLKPANVMVGEFGEVLLIDWGVRAGTPGFAAPEREGDARSDVYSLGAMLRAMLPEGAPKLLRAVAAKAMRDDPAGRYESVRALMGDVGRFLDGEPVEAYRENVWERSVRVLGKHSTLAALVAAYLVMRGLVLFFFGR